VSSSYCLVSGTMRHIINITNQNPFISHHTSSQTSFSLWILQDAAEINVFCFLIMCIKSQVRGKDQKYLVGLLEFEL